MRGTAELISCGSGHFPSAVRATAAQSLKPSDLLKECNKYSVSDPNPFPPEAEQELSSGCRSDCLVL
jgi:hypothetical protein